MKDIGLTIKFVEKEFIFGATKEDTKANDLITICTEKGFIYGKMVGNMKENM